MIDVPHWPVQQIKGWECPKCCSVWGPSVQGCLYCNERKAAKTVPEDPKLTPLGPAGW